MTILVFREDVTLSQLSKSHLLHQNFYVVFLAILKDTSVFISDSGVAPEGVGEGGCSPLTGVC